MQENPCIHQLQVNCLSQNSSSDCHCLLLFLRLSGLPVEQPSLCNANLLGKCIQIHWHATHSTQCQKKKIKAMRDTSCHNRYFRELYVHAEERAQMGREKRKQAHRASSPPLCALLCHGKAREESWEIVEEAKKR